MDHQTRVCRVHNRRASVKGVPRYCSSSFTSKIVSQHHKIATTPSSYFITAHYLHEKLTVGHRCLNASFKKNSCRLLEKLSCVTWWHWYTDRLTVSHDWRFFLTVVFPRMSRHSRDRSLCAASEVLVRQRYFLQVSDPVYDVVDTTLQSRNVCDHHQLLGLLFLRSWLHDERTGHLGSVERNGMKTSLFRKVACCEKNYVTVSTGPYWVSVRFVGCLYWFLQHQNPNHTTNYLYRKSSAVVEVTHTLSGIWFLQISSQSLSRYNKLGVYRGGWLRSILFDRTSILFVEQAVHRPSTPYLGALSTFVWKKQDVVWSDQALLHLGDSHAWDSRL